MVSSIITSTQSRKSTTTTTLISTMWLLSTMSMLIQINGFIMVPSQQQQQQQQHQQGIIQRSLCNVGSNNSVTSRQQLPATTTSTSTKLSMIGDLFSGGGGSSSQLLLNDKTVALQESLVANTSLQNKQLKCVYRGSVDGWSAINFHNNVDGKGSCLVVILTRSGKLIGGFNPVGWRSTDDYYDSNSAFLWYAKNGRSPSSTATKCPILTGGKYVRFHSFGCLFLFQKWCYCNGFILNNYDVPTRGSSLDL